ncbi:MAG TPA: CRISPR-associated helicase Cas3' [Clostridia bacterium]|nr:CRISPR-associated helicase Cas3' [Clostridia bacterium]
MEEKFAAHIRDDGKIQTVKEHLDGVANLAEGFGNSFSSGDYAYLCGMLHDIGKYSKKFQKRIFEGGNRADHSTAGALEINNRLQGIGFLLSYCVAGHHTGLPDGGSIADTIDEPTLNGRLRRKLEPYIKFEDEVNIKELIPSSALPIRPLKKIGFSVSFYIRMLFSCLVDGDFLDTENFMSDNPRNVIDKSINLLNLKLDEYIKGFGSPTSEINKKRTEILNCCIEKSTCNKGLYSLTVPTGGGKTVSSLAFALKHAKKHKIDRVIYVIPYNSIIEQNAGVFKKILGEENVLEHHSDFSYDDKDDDINKLLQRQKLSTENWDMPVVVTTTVQFFESLFANKTSKCRKLHNIANSVIIFDEAQMFPTQYLLPCVHAISELVFNYGSTAVLCSATQPALNSFFPKEIECQEICENTKELFEFFKRTKIIQLGELEDKELAERMNTEKQVLCIVNTRKQAQNIFKLLDNDGSYHLSTLMYPQHRKRIFSEIRNRLKDGLPCRVVSTSLIEAGVDVDFPVVYRAEAGLDSEIQAAGRCNREGKRGESPVYIFKPCEEYRQHMPSMLRRPTEIAHSIASQFYDISTPEAISSYFSLLYKMTGSGLDTKNIVEKFENGFEKGMSFPFAQIATEFNLIESSTYSIVIPDNYEAKKLVQILRSGERSKQLLRQLQQYTVSVYKCNYDALYGSGSIEPLDEEIAVLIDLEKYSDKTGLDANVYSGVGIYL